MICENILKVPPRPTVGNGACSHKIDYVTFFRRFLISKDIKIALLFQELRQFCWNKWIFPFGQSGLASRWRVCYQWGLPRLVFTHFLLNEVITLSWYNKSFLKMLHVVATQALLLCLYVLKRKEKIRKSTQKKKHWEMFRNIKIGFCVTETCFCDGNLFLWQKLASLTEDFSLTEILVRGRNDFLWWKKKNLWRKLFSVTESFFFLWQKLFLWQKCVSLTKTQTETCSDISLLLWLMFVYVTKNVSVTETYSVQRTLF